MGEYGTGSFWGRGSLLVRRLTRLIWWLGPDRPLTETTLSIRPSWVHRRL